MRTQRFPDDAALSQALADRLVSVLAGPYSTPVGIMLAGGSTPLAAYAQLAREKRVVSPHVLVFFSDDRHVPPDHAQSNYHNIAPSLHKAGIADEQIVRVRGEWAIEDAVRDYDRQIAAFSSSGGRMIIGFLGLGADGHTASLFNDGDLARSVGVNAVGVQRPDGLKGISVSPEVLDSVEELIFVVSGASKAKMVHNLLHAPETITAGKAVRGNAQVMLWADTAALS
ncbi:MAG: 6-phosphogluconolactonase [Kiritimatiellae bacterium]|nr:6-phosphogluconolactonase [Kiritimatiellia bacterium]MCO5061287.1 6-phosphogluconolactonase [Kiritimatiellia bacterium]MCO6400203.1 6-phosphogluconolactonase [Verrucomicrobiota bacterium]